MSWQIRYMCLHQRFGSLVVVSAAIVVLSGMPVHGQGTGAVRGAVTFTDGVQPIHGAVVLLIGPGLVALTAENGEFEIENVPAW